MNPSLRGNALKSGRFLVLFALLVLLVLVRNERHHHVLVPAPVRWVGVGRGAGAVTPRGQYSVTLYTVGNQGVSTRSYRGRVVSVWNPLNRKTIFLYIRLHNGNLAGS